MRPEMRIRLIAGAAAVGALIAGSAHAAVFADFVSVTVPGHDVVTFTSFDETTETFTGSTVLPAGLSAGTVILTEPDGTTLSDILTLLVDPSTGGLDILFFSDPAIAPPVDILPNQLTLAETGGVQDVSSFFGPPGTVQVLVGSDIDTTRSVPEPAAWTMMLVGVGLAGGALRARRRTAAAV
jgi:hypothetical protein